MDDLEKLREFIFDAIQEERDYLIEHLDEMGQFEAGRVKGKILAYQHISQEIRKKIKYGFND